MPEEWVVVVEAVCTTMELDLPSLQQVLEAVEECSPVALHGSGRCALQLRVQASDFEGALRAALAHWEGAVGSTPHAGFELVRVEVMTAAEFDHDCRIAYGEAPGISGWEAPVDPYDERLADELLRQALQDEVTGLEGSALFTHHLEEAVNGSRHSGAASAVVLIELGQAASEHPDSSGSDNEELLFAVGQRLVGIVGDSHRAARLDGDRFAVLVEDATEHAAVALAHRILAALSAPFLVGSGVVSIDACAGVSAGQGEGGATAVLARAADALAAAKRTRTGGCGLYVGDAAGETRPCTETQERRASLRSALDLLRAAASAADTSSCLQEAADSVMARVCGYTGWPMSVLCLLDSASGRVAPMSTWYSPPPGHHAAAGRLTVMADARDAPLYRRVSASRRSEWSCDVSQDLPWASRLASELGAEAVVVVPLLSSDHQVAGALHFFIHDRQTPDPLVLDTVGLAALHLRPLVDNSGRHGLGVAREQPPRAMAGEVGGATPAWVPSRYELFGWDPGHPAPSLASLLSPPGVAAPPTAGLERALAVTYERLSGSVRSRAAHGPSVRRGLPDPPR